MSFSMPKMAFAQYAKELRKKLPTLTEAQSESWTWIMTMQRCPSGGCYAGVVICDSGVKCNQCGFVLLLIT